MSDYLTTNELADWLGLSADTRATKLGGAAKIATAFRNTPPQTHTGMGSIKWAIFRNQNHSALIFNLNLLFADSIAIPVVVGSSPISHPKEFSSEQMSPHGLRAHLRLCTRDTRERL
ncbi:hypothetical protein [Paraburkholderia guartelaensis]|uniref:DUF4224 domain-containing protein n=1 Tax=Paraburkholderia guartelaensis TaxID=2546446 RepID=A0ABU9SLU8_9BURK